MSRSQKIGAYQCNADTIEDWARTVNYPYIRQGLFEIAQRWREMAERLERIENVARDFEAFRRNALGPFVAERVSH
jgi:hypothetical protein